MWTIGQLAKRFHLSRSTLLYYDRQGVLKPSGRTPSGYRLYEPSDLKKLERIVLLREAGLPLKTIATLLIPTSNTLEAALEERLNQLNQEISHLRGQQQVIASLLQKGDIKKRSRIITKSGWVALLAGVGLDEAGMRKWHALFEKSAPEAHQDFLESLGIPAEEVSTIREWSQALALKENQTLPDG
ncbi:MAG: MerR family transcriptional regulator [Magnetococcales bacterium]|nr:MerR family transcriptional regulator [Magnetococcales bacterium]